MTLIVLYLAAVVAANLTVTWLGPVATIPNAFLLIDTGEPENITIDTTARTISGSFHKTNGSQCLASPCNRLYFYATYSKAGATAGSSPGVGAYV